MSGNLLKKSLMFILWGCGAAVAGDVVPEMNESWILAEHLMPGWQSMALATRYYNPEGHAVNKTPWRSVSFAGYINVIDPNGLIGLSAVAADAKAFDEFGDPIDTAGVWEYPRPYRPLIYSTTWERNTGQRMVRVVPFDFSIDMSMKRGAPFPLLLSRIEWSIGALLSDDVRAIDIPFVPTAGWIEPVPGLEVLVEKAVAEEGRYEYDMQIRYDPNRVSCFDARERPAGFVGRTYEAPYSWPSGKLPEMIILGVDVLDADGSSVWNRSGGSLSSMGGFSDSDGLRIVTRSGGGLCSACGNAAFIRHIIAFEPYNQDLQFILENILVPTE